MPQSYMCLFDFSPRSPAPPQMCARSDRATVPWPCPARTPWARHAPLLHPTSTPSPPGASGYMHSSRRHHTWANQPAYGPPLGGAQPRGACKATHCAQSWQGLPWLLSKADTAWMTDIAPVQCGAGGSGQPDTHQCAQRTAHRRRRCPRSASPVTARAWEVAGGVLPRFRS